MKSKIISISFVVFIAIVLTGCDKDDDNAIEKFPDVLFGTWVTNVVPVSDYGYFDGTASHTYNEDNTYKAEIDFVDPVSNCRAVIDYTGTYSGGEGTLVTNPDGGAVEITLCGDASLNQPSTDHSNDLLESAKSTVEYEVDGNTLILTHSDGLQRIYRRQ